jgi:hypothetical protein
MMFLFVITVDLVCESCYYKGDRTEFEESSDYCRECLSEHAMCPKCRAPIIQPPSQNNKIQENSSL